jgi:hypothetical protein
VEQKQLLTFNLGSYVLNNMEEKLRQLAKLELDVYTYYKRYKIHDPRNTDKVLYVDTSKMTKNGDTFYEYKDDMLEFLNEPKKIGSYTFERINNDIIITL